MKETKDRAPQRRPAWVRHTMLWLCALGIVLSPGCDTNADFNVIKITFDQLAPISVHPAVLKDGQLVRQCGTGNVDGFLINMALLSTERKEIQGGSANDKDRSIRPGDWVDTRRVLQAGDDSGQPRDIRLDNALDVKLGCIDPLNSARLGSDTPLTCDGIENPPATLNSVRYVPNVNERATGNNLIVLMDMSGSTKGFVNNYEGDFDPANQDKENSPSGTLKLTDLKQVASDYGTFRLSVMKEILGTLNVRNDGGQIQDRFAMVGFGEGLGTVDNLEVPCTVPEAAGKTWSDALPLCFGITNNDYWMNGIDAFLNRTKPGRSNLWDALDKTYTFLESQGDLARSNHILVVTDGPDTCSDTQALGNCQSPCGSKKAQDIIQRLEANATDPNKPKIHIHFVQMEAPGYPGTDPRQVEVSCVSGGHYQFINNNTLPKNENDDEFRRAVRESIYRVRYALLGHWEAALTVASFGTAADTPAGGLYALPGVITIRSSSNLTGSAGDAIKTLTGGGIGVWDERLRVRKACSEDVDCPTGGLADNGCNIFCSSETKICPYKDDALTPKVPSGRPCADGSGGTCCDGECVTDGSVCEACDPLPWFK